MDDCRSYQICFDIDYTKITISAHCKMNTIGKDISVQYAQLRKDARLVAIMRNRCLEAATKAYLRSVTDTDI